MSQGRRGGPGPPPRHRPLPGSPQGGAPGTRYVRSFVRSEERSEILAWLEALRPLWELRFSEHRPPPEGQVQRPLLRPVWWLGSWQFACLGYYHPPEGVRDRCVRAEPFPPVMARWVQRIERLVRESVPREHVPPGWALDTCLVNLYGEHLVDGRWEDRARVGDHRDFEPGPVASVSLGARAFFQFVDRGGREAEHRWLEDGSLLVFAGPRHKDRWFHRVQRVERRGEPLPPHLPEFVTRRVNFTFRHVPPEHVVPLEGLSPEARRDVSGYVNTLAGRSPWWAAARERANP